MKKFKETGELRYMYQTELGKVYFKYNMAFGAHKDLSKRIISDKVLRDKAFGIVINPYYDGYQQVRK